MTPEEIFAVDPRIRWIGLATSKGKAIFCQMKKDVKSLTPEEDDRAMLELRTQFLTEMCGPVTVWAGPVNYIALSYEKFTELVVTLKDKYVALTLERETPPDMFKRIAESIRALDK